MEVKSFTYQKSVFGTYYETGTAKSAEDGQPHCEDAE